MNDLEITKLCAEAMLINVEMKGHGRDARWVVGGHLVYEPLWNDADAMRLLKAFHIWIGGWLENGMVSAAIDGKFLTCGEDLNRAICTCVSKMQSARAKPLASAEIK